MLGAALCITANSGCQCPLWVKSRHQGTLNQCPLYPQKRTSELSRAMSALCQKQTSRLYSVASRWGGPLHRRELGHRAHPTSELRAAISEIAEAAFARNIKSHGENQLGHVRRLLEQRIGHSSLKYIGHTLGSGYLMRQSSGRTLAHRSSHLAHPHADPFAHVARRELKPLVSPVRLASRVVKTRLTVQVVEIGADELAILRGGLGFLHRALSGISA